MAKPLKPTDILVLTAPDSGWVGERAILGEAELAVLVGLIEPELDARAREKFETAIQSIFAFAVENIKAHRERDGFSAAGFRRDLDNFLAAMEKAQSIVTRLDPAICALLDHEFAEATRPRGSMRDPMASYEQWRKETLERLGTITAIGRRLELKGVRGERSTVYRQMVRGLLALVYDVTGAIPKRKTARCEVGSKRSQTDDYWFLTLSHELADFVDAHANRKDPQQPAETTKEDPASNQSGESPAAEDATKMRRLPPSAQFARRRKVEGPGSLALIVRQELEAFKKEVTAKKVQARRAG